MVKRRHIITMVIGIFAIIALALVAVPIMMLYGVDTNAAAKRSEFILHDEINDSTVKIDKRSYGFTNSQDYNRYYVRGNPEEMSMILVNNSDATDVISNGAVLYIDLGPDKYFYMRRMSEHNVPMQGYEYNTSNKSDLINRNNSKTSVSNIFLPYHMIIEAVEPQHCSDESRGVFTENKVYRLYDAYEFDDIVAFYDKYYCFNTTMTDGTLAVKNKDGCFYINNLGNGEITFHTMVECVADNIA